MSALSFGVQVRWAVALAYTMNNGSDVLAFQLDENPFYRSSVQRPANSEIAKLRSADTISTFDIPHADAHQTSPPHRFHFGFSLRYVLRRHNNKNEYTSTKSMPLPVTQSHRKIKFFASSVHLTLLKFIHLIATAGEKKT